MADDVEPEGPSMEEQRAAIAAKAKAEAAEDLATLREFQGLAADRDATIGALLDALEGLTARLNHRGRILAFVARRDFYQVFLDAIDAMVDQAVNEVEI